MRVGINTLFYIPKEVGGSETYLRQTLCAIAETNQNVEIVLFTNIENHASLRADTKGYPQVSLHKLNLRATNRFSRILSEQFILPFRIKQEGIDVLWSPGYTPCCASPCPQVTSILDMQYKSHPEDLSWLARVTTDILIKAACRCSSQLITISDFSSSEIVQHCKVNPAKITVTHLAADPQFSVPATKQDIRRARTKVGLGEQDVFILAIANSYPHKNLHTLVRGLNCVEKELPHRLLLLGKSRRGEPELAQACSEARDPGRILRAEGLDEEALIALMQSADLVVFPSLYEGFGLPVLESMMAGTPVITTRRASLTEVGGEHAIYVDEPCSPNDFARAMTKTLASGTKDDEKTIAAARAWANRFTWDRTAKMTLEVLRKAVLC